MDEKRKPKIKAMCIFENEGKTLATKGYDKSKNEIFYRLIGGSVEFGEKVIDGIKREIKEELGCDVENHTFVKIVENIFTYDGKKGHEIIFVYKGDLTNKGLYEKQKIHIIEPYGEFDAEWIPITDIITGKVILYPATDYSKILIQ